MVAIQPYVLDVRRWLAKLGVSATGNDLMIGDYIDHRWPHLTRGARKNILKAAMRPAK